MLAADYPFLDLFWTMLIVFLWVVWLWVLFTVFADIFRRDDISGWAKTGWLIFTIVLPFLGVFIYVITQNEEMTKRNMERAKRQRRQYDDYVRDTADDGSAVEEINKAKQLLDSGAISQEEFESIKRRALS